MNNKWFLEKIEEEDFVYQCFSFKPEIQNHTFIGNEFIGFKRDYDLEPEEIFNRILEAGPEGLLPELKNALQEIMGEGNYKYDGNEIGPDEFSLYFFIKAKSYKKILKKIESWRDYNEFNDLMWWEEKKDIL